MFKIINNTIININQISKVEYVGVDPKDEKNYCKIYLIDGDSLGILKEGTIEEVFNFLTN